VEGFNHDSVMLFFLSPTRASESGRRANGAQEHGLPINEHENPITLRAGDGIPRIFPVVEEKAVVVGVAAVRAAGILALAVDDRLPVPLKAKPGRSLSCRHLARWPDRKVAVGPNVVTNVVRCRRPFERLVAQRSQTRDPRTMLPVDVDVPPRPGAAAPSAGGPGE